MVLVVNVVIVCCFGCFIVIITPQFDNSVGYVRVFVVVLVA